MNAQPSLSPLQQRLLATYQHTMPMTVRPFASMAAELGVDENDVIAALDDLQSRAVVSRVGPVFRPGRAGASTLAAMAVPPHALERVAKLVSCFEEVNHNYEREHTFNLWFVVTASNRARVDAVLAQMSACTGLEVIDLPLERGYHIDLGFAL
ncbi:MAG: Lrp/AsnC family transcriptional regulator [Gammaproteobacteria bacterium]